MRKIVMLLSAASLAACGQGSETANQPAPAPKKEKPKYCFFKDAESKDWAAKRGKDGNVVVTGKLYRSDGRYMAVLGEPKINGSAVELWPSISVNNTGASMPDGWWELTTAIPNSGAIDTVDVKCGSKTFAHFVLKPA